MFSHFFGSYLVTKGRITQEQFSQIKEAEKSARVKLGLIAISEKMLTEKQAEEINRAQAVQDKRFGDIAIEKGYLTEDQLQDLLGLQGNSYMVFIQTVVDNNILTLNEVEDLLVQYQSDFHFTEYDIEALKSGDIDQIAPLFINTGKTIYDDLCSLAVRSIIRFISPKLSLLPIRQEEEYKFKHLAVQKLAGDHDVFVAFGDHDGSLLTIASYFGREDFSYMDEDAFDSVCEFINCINGLYASKLSHEGIDIDMLPPSFNSDSSITGSKPFYVLPIQFENAAVDFVISVDNQVEFK